MADSVPGRWPIKRLLIANRGEIAIRIARSARAAGIVALGIYSAADARAAHLAVMDDALEIGPGPASESYLDITRVLGAARALRADAVHPGYGFLSERAAFARAVRDAGLIFVGPSAEAIAAMGDKTEAKRRARACGVPVVPGYDGEDQSDERLRSEAVTLGTPLLIKASAGGGGRGMRVVSDLAAFDEALAAARREALGAFGSDRMLLERYLERPRHIEFQILADSYGTTLHLGERECSIQRRHQKVIEEAPSVAVDYELRERMGNAAIRVAESVGYTNAGTVEFLLDARGAFYFLEMNARLQVEHPVTELVHGIDLVRWQLALAAGARLDLERDTIAPRGWAIEARLNAEDPHNGYLPATGTILRWEPPREDGIRLDAGVAAGSEISIYYDSMLAKLIAYGADRAQAVERLTRALEAFHIDGVRTNLALLLAIAREPDFRAGETTTAYLPEHPSLAESAADEPDAAFYLAAAAVAVDPRGWRVADVGIPVHIAGGTRAIALVASRTSDGPSSWTFAGDLHADVRIEATDGRIAVSRGDQRFGGVARVDERGVDVRYDGTHYRFTFVAPPAVQGGHAHGAGAAGAIVSPMPGTIVKVTVRPGDAVGERDLLVVLEAMKMEHRIEATRDGIVRAVNVEPGAVVRGGTTLVELEGTVKAG